MKEYIKNQVILFGIMVVCFMITLCSEYMVANAATTTDGLEYEIWSDTVTITGYSGTATSVVIPEEIDGYEVTDIGYHEFYNFDGISEIIIPSSVVYINSSAFSGCTNLMAIKVDNSNEVYSSEEGVLFNKNKTALELCPAGKSGEYIIPASVRYIYSSAFRGCKNLKTLTIPSGVTYIYSGGFSECANLMAINVDNSNEVYSSAEGVLFDKNKTTLEICPAGKSGEYIIPASVTSIGNSAFEGCESLSSIIIPASVTSIGNSAFEGCESLSSIIIPTSVTSIGNSAFKGCESLSSIIIPTSVTSISNSTFYGCRSLKEITIPEGVTNIGDWAFCYCESLTEITIPKGVTNIGDWAFNDCQSLIGITIPTGVTSIGESVFCNCESLTEITIPEGVTSIGESTFSWCKSLKEITIPEGVTSIDDSAFNGCVNLTEIIIPESVASIGNGAFSYCPSLLGIEVADSNKTYSSYEGVLYSKDKTRLVVYPKGKGGEYVIPDEVTSIGDDAFSWCSDLTTVLIPNSVIEIGDDAFYSCYDLTILCDKGSYAEEYAKQNYIKYKLDITKFTASISQLSYKCNGEYIEPVVTIKEMENEVTLCNGVDYKVTYDNNIEPGTATITIVGIGDFIGTIKIEFTILQCEITELLKYSIEGNTVTITGYEGHIKDIVIPETIEGYKVTSIADYAFYECDKITTITIPEGVTNIGNYAFEFCGNLKNVTIPASVTNIGTYAFLLCEDLTEINVSDYNLVYSSYEGVLFNKNKTVLLKYPEGKELAYVIPKGVETIEDMAFAYCYNLSSISIPDGVISIGKSAFYSCHNITTLIVPNSVTSIKELAFSNCTGLENISIPASVSIGKYVFQNCTSLRTITQNGGITYSIENGTATVTDYNGTSENVVIPENIGGYTVTAIGDYAFYECKTIGTIVIPSNIKLIGDCAFYDCENLQAISIPEGVTSIGQDAFCNCRKVTTVTIPASVSYIGYEPFAGCDSLTKVEVAVGNMYFSSYDGVVFNKNKTSLLICPPGKTGTYTIPMGVTEIGMFAFGTCKNLTAIIIPEGVKCIGYGAFGKCQGISTITIPASVTNIEARAFVLCEKLEKIDVDKNNTCFISYDGVLFNKNRTSLIAYPAGKDGGYAIPVGVTNISDGAFACCYNLTTINIPSGVKYIGDGAFDECLGLTTIYIPDGVTSIGEEAFSTCWNLTSIRLPKGIDEIRDFTFWDCRSLTSIDIPEGVTSIGWWTFAYCDNLTMIKIPNSVESVGFSAFTGRFTILCEKGSYIEEYAISKNINCKYCLDKYIADISQSSFTYTGNYIKPIVTVKETVNGKIVTLTVSKDYEVTYNNNKIPGTATVTITGIGDYYGTITKTFKILPSKVSGFTYSARTAASVTLKWAKNNSADGYEIQQYKSGKWITIKTITSNAKESYKVTGLSPSVSYNFRIRVYNLVGNTKLYGEYTSKSVKTLPSVVKSFSHSARTAASVTLKWTKNTSADGYVIEQYKGGKWITIKTITKNSTVKYKVTGLKPSVNYKFRIKAYKMDGSTKLYASTYSTKSVRTLPSTVKNFTYKARTAKTITLKWAKNTSADGYVIQQYKGGKWVKIKTVTKNTTENYKVTGLKSGTTYKFRIKAYKKDGSKKLYSLSYTTKSVKTLAK